MAATPTKFPMCRKRPWNMDRFPDLSPDGQTIAFFHPATAPIWGDIWVIPVAGGQARQLTFDACESGWPSWTPDGRSIVFSSTRGGSLTLWRVPAAGGTPAPLTTGAGEDTEPDISADGDTLLYSTQRKSWSLMLLDPATGQEKELLSRRTPDLAFQRSLPVAIGSRSVSQWGPARTSTSVSADGRDVRQVTHGEGEQNIMPQWSGDGASLYFYQMGPSKSFRKIPVEGGTSIGSGCLGLSQGRVCEGRSARPRGRVYDRGGRPAEGDGGSGPGVREGTDAGSDHQQPSLVTRFPDHLRRHTSPRIQAATSGTAGMWRHARPMGGHAALSREGFMPIPAADGSRLFYIRDTGAARSTREVWTASVDGANPRKVGTIGPLPPDVELRRLADGPDRLHQVECQPARAVGGAAAPVKRSGK